MAASSNKIGLAVGEHTIRVSESRMERGKAVIVSLATYAIDDTVDWHRPDELGARFREFLDTHGIASRHAVIGLPAIWLTTRSRTVPQMDEPVAYRDMMVLHAERAFSVDARDIVIDYVVRDETEVTFVAASRRRIDQVQAFAVAAGLVADVVTASAFALCAAGDRASKPTLVVDAGSSEAVLVRSGIPGHLTTIGGSGSASIQLAQGLNRAILTDTSLDAGDVQDLTLWRSSGVGTDACNLFAQQLATMSVDAPEAHRIAPIHINGMAPTEQLDFATAMALATVHTRESSRVVDFQHSRLAPVVESRFDRKMQVAAAVIGLLCIGIGSLLYVWQARATLVADLQEQLNQMRDQVDQARSFIVTVDRANRWYGDRPQCLECLRELTLCFPPNSEIWAKDLTLDNTMKGILSGNATTNQAVLDLRGELQTHTRFADVKLIYLRNSTRGNNQTAFALSFRFVPGDVRMRPKGGPTSAE